MIHKPDWKETQERFTAWWNHQPLDRPMLNIVAKKSTPSHPLEPVTRPDSAMEFHLDVDYNVKQMRNYCRTHEFLAEAFPHLSLNIGPGSMALYLGCEPKFAWDTVWFEPCIAQDWSEIGELDFCAENKWWKRHLEMIRSAQAMANGEFLVDIPDIIENLDILSAMRGPQSLCYDLYDCPQALKQYVSRIDELYFQYYDAMRDIVKLPDNSCSYTAFEIWGKGRTAKIQCDFSALMSPDQFREFVLPSLRKQCQHLDHSIYHLDGPDCIRHLDALMEIDELDALQWTAGAGHPDGGDTGWYPIYDKVREARKNLWIRMDASTYEESLEKSRQLVKRYGKDCLYLLYPVMTQTQGHELLNKAYNAWK